MKKTLQKNRNTADSSEFFLNIRYYQNNSWQGSVQRLDTGETINFRSALELVHLIEAVAGRQGNREDQAHRIRKWKSAREVDQTILENGRSG